MTTALILTGWAVVDALLVAFVRAACRQRDAQIPHP